MPSITHLLEHCRASKSLFLALDRDGTLVPYEAKPEDAVMPERTRHVLNRLAEMPNVILALVSARGSARLKNDVDAPEIILAGNYGMEIRFSNKEQWVAPAVLKVVPEMRQLHNDLESITRRFDGAILEDDFYSFCLHWHLVPLEERNSLHLALMELQPKLISVVMRSLPTSYEFLPKLAWDKSYALEIIASQKQLQEKDVLYLFVGDSEPDEPAFDWVNKRNGYSVKVGSSTAATKAMLLLDHPNELASFLEELLSQRSIFVAAAYRDDEDAAEREKRIDQVFTNLKHSYASGLRQRIEELKTIVEAAKNNPEDPLSLAAARLQVHRLKGTVGSYGFTEISLLLAEIETAIEKIESAQSSTESRQELWKKAISAIEGNFAKAIAAANSNS